MTKMAEMVWRMTALALFVLVNVAAVQAQQVLANSDMGGCNGPLAGWTGVFISGSQPFAASYVPSSAGFSLDDDSCAATWTDGSTPYTQTVSLTPGLYDFEARLACASASFTSATCDFSLSIGGNSISLTGTTSKSFSTNADTYDTITADNIPINTANVDVVLSCSVSSFSAGCFVTTATLTFDSLIVGDPHVTGWNGIPFDFIGESGSSYCLISQSDLQVNTQLGRQQVGDHAFTSGPVMMIIAILTPDHTILANAGGSSISDSGFVSVDGVKVGEGQNVVTEDGISVSFQIVNANAKDLGLGSDDHIAATCQVEIKGSYRFTIYFVENGRDRLLPDRWLTRFARRYLDLSVSLLDESLDAQGVLGQTHIRAEDKTRSIKDWKLQGSEDDFKVRDGVLGSDFAFNKFRV